MKFNVLKFFVFVTISILVFNFSENKAFEVSESNTNQAIDPSWLPASNSNKFQPIKIKYIHVDANIESNKRPSPFDDEKYKKFMEVVINPVTEYFTKIIKLAHVEALEEGYNLECKATTRDKDKKPITFKKNVNEDIKGYVNF